jgi:hypothetical protein
MWEESQNQDGEKDIINFGEEERAKGEVEGKKRGEAKPLEQSSGETWNTWGSALGKGEKVLTKAEVISNLSKMELTIKNIMKTDEIDFLFGRYGFNEALYQASRVFDKWLRKKGKDYSEFSQKDMWEETKKMALLDRLRAEVLDFYGVTGRDRVDYRAYTLSLMKALKGYGFDGWILKARELEELEVKKKGYDREILHVLTLLTLKFNIWYKENRVEEAQ